MVRKNLRELKVKDLKPNSRWFTITVKILRIGDERSVLSRKDGNQHRVAEAVVGDETGTVVMTVWDEDIDRVKERVGSTVRITNGSTSVFKGNLRLVLNRFSVLEEAEEQITHVNETFNISEGIKRHF